jgi:hypothetical protein
MVGAASAINFISETLSSMELSSALEFFKHLVVTLAAGVIVDWLLRRRRVERANEEVLHSVHRLIASRDAQSVHRINSIIASVARNHRLSDERLYNISLLVDEAINEIIGNPYLTEGQKQDYCAFADRIKRENAKSVIAPATVRVSEGRRWDMGVILAAAILGAMLFSFLGANMSTGMITLDKDAIKRFFWMAAIAVSVPAFLFWLLALYRDLNDWKEEHPGRRFTGNLSKYLKTKKKKH